MKQPLINVDIKLFIRGKGSNPLGTIFYFQGSSNGFKRLVTYAFVIQVFHFISNHFNKGTPKRTPKLYKTCPPKMIENEQSASMTMRFL